MVKEIHKFEPEENITDLTRDNTYVRAICSECGRYEESRLHYHDFKLVFGGYTCEICGMTIDAEVHQGINVEGITDRPVRELEPLKSDEEFWDGVTPKVNEGGTLRQRLGEMLYPDKPKNPHPAKVSEEKVDSLYDNVVYSNPDSPQKEKKKSFFTRGDKAILIYVGLASTLNVVATAFNAIMLFN